MCSSDLFPSHDNWGSGIFPEDVKEAIQNGIVKVNVNSELRVAFYDALKQKIDEEGPASAQGSGEAREIAIYKLMPDSISAMEKIVEEKMIMFGSDNKI